MRSKLFSSYDLIGDSKNIINIIDQIKKISIKLKVESL